MRVVADPWECLICPYVDATCRGLAEHVVEVHDDWVRGNQVPPLRRREAEENLSSWGF